MLLNARNIFENVLKHAEGNYGFAQVGIDLSVKNIRRIRGGKLYAENGKKEIAEYEEVECVEVIGTPKTWILEKGNCYSITFEQDLKLDDKHAAIIIGKSTSNRVALHFRSGLFDPGFESEGGCGCNMYCFSDFCEIEQGAKVAQVIVIETEQSEKYNGSYLKEKDIR